MLRAFAPPTAAMDAPTLAAYARSAADYAADWLAQPAPEDLYARPAHADVAEFMGYRNLVRTVAEPSGAGVTVTIGGARFAATPMEKVQGAAIAAIRPDDLSSTADGPIAASGSRSSPSFAISTEWPAFFAASSAATKLVRQSASRWRSSAVATSFHAVV